MSRSSYYEQNLLAVAGAEYLNRSNELELYQELEAGAVAGVMSGSYEQLQEL